MEVKADVRHDYWVTLHPSPAGLVALLSLCPRTFLMFVLGILYTLTVRRTLKSPPTLLP